MFAAAVNNDDFIIQLLKKSFQTSLITGQPTLLWMYKSHKTHNVKERFYISVALIQL